MQNLCSGLVRCSREAPGSITEQSVDMEGHQKALGQFGSLVQPHRIDLNGIQLYSIIR